MPDDGIEIVESDLAAAHGDIGMERKHKMATELASRHADIADHADETPAWCKDAKDVSPDLFQLIQECLVVIDVAELVIMLVVSLEVPVRRRRDHKMHALRREKGQVPCVAIYESVRGGIRVHHADMTRCPMRALANLSMDKSCAGVT